MTQPTDPFAFVLSFRYLPGGGRDAALLEATLPSGAKFVCDTNQLTGKLGANLQLFYQATKAANSSSGTENALTVSPPTWAESLITKVAPGTAYGVSPQKDTEKKKAASRAIQDALDNLEITI